MQHTQSELPVPLRKWGEGKALLCYYRVNEAGLTKGVSVLTSPNYLVVELQVLSLHFRFYS